MIIEWIRITGFRNFKDAKIKLNEKTLLIGTNDVGKTNMLYALRLIFDRSLNDNDVNLTESDFYMHERTQEIVITVKIKDIEEDCLISHFGGAVKSGTVFIKYKKRRDTDYEIFQGFSEDTLSKIQGRSYLRRIHMKYVSTNRDLDLYIKKERKSIIRNSVEKLIKEYPGKHLQDIKHIQKLNTDLNMLNSNVNKLNYISRSMTKISEELDKLSIHNEPINVSLIAGNNDIQDMLDNLDLSMSHDNKQVKVGGDGRKNQVFLATWAANKITSDTPSEVTFVAIEEPESHLHPHQQRRLSKYLVENLEGVLILSSHSPQITCEFPPDSIVKLDFIHNKGTIAAGGGCNTDIEGLFDSLAYRLDLISSEAFFANLVILVEGPSEIVFYKALASALEIDLDRYNISIVSVNGIAFSEYTAVLESLNIKWLIRTDNDIAKVPKNPFKRAVGIKRGLEAAMKCTNHERYDILQMLYEEFSTKGQWKDDLPNVPKCSEIYINRVIEELANFNIFISNKDLEQDLVDSPLFHSLSNYYGKTGVNELVKRMQTKKALNMYAYISENIIDLKKVSKHKLAEPLYTAIKLLECQGNKKCKNIKKSNRYVNLKGGRRRKRIETHKRTRRYSSRNRKFGS